MSEAAIVNAIAVDLIAMANGDARKALVIAAAWLPADDLPLCMQPGFDPESPGREYEIRKADAEAAYGAADEIPEHDCPRQRFLDDPIAMEYKVASQVVGLIPCPVCDAADDDSKWYQGSSRNPGL
jgi:hypothetical protein